MHIYLVGGAVRDLLLGLPIAERDWVVVGSTPEEMVTLGFLPIGKEFPVFLHPHTFEEYALARTERKIAKGYKGFSFYADKDITLEQDLQRRDLTINAMAMDENKNIIDPFGGQQDLANRILRHVSSAFHEDPVRVLRIARFCAKFPDFNIHPDTLSLMQHMVDNGEIDALVAERVWKEFQRALCNKAPIRFFDALHACGALEKLFPSIPFNGLGLEKLRENPPIENPIIAFAILLYGVDESTILKLAQRYRIPTQYSDLAILLNKYGETYLNLDANSASTILNLLLKTDAIRRKARFYDFLSASRIIFGKNNHHERLKQALDISKNIETRPLQQAGIKGKEFADKLNELRIAAIDQLIKSN